MNMKKISAAAIIIVLVAAGWYFFKPEGEELSQEQAPTTSEPANEANAIEFTHQGELDDVTDGAVVRGITTVSSTKGTAQAGFDDDLYVLEVLFIDLPDPQGDDFYEGWVVRRGADMSVISTGVIEKEDDTMSSNVFTSPVNLLDHDFYVLTLEPNDGDPAPADHILEGVLSN